MSISLFDELKTGLTQAIDFAKGNGEASVAVYDDNLKYDDVKIFNSPEILKTGCLTQG